MPVTNTKVSFFNSSTANKITMFSYKSTKIAHDMRLGYSILCKSVKSRYKVVPSWRSASHLSYILPGVSFFCSLANNDIASDKGAFLWGLVNGLQCFTPSLAASKILTLGAYTLDIYLGYLNDKQYLGKRDVNDACIATRYFKNYSETVYAILVLGNISANVFDQNDIGLILFTISLLFKLIYLTRDQQLSINSFFYALILSLAPLVFLFSVENDSSLILGLATLTLALYLVDYFYVQRAQGGFKELSVVQDINVQNESQEGCDIELLDVQTSSVNVCV